MAANRFDMPVRYEGDGRAIIRMQGITKIFESAAGAATVLKNIDIAVDQGQFVSIIGRSGSGKSTLVNMITGIDRPTAGSVEVAGRPIHNMPEGTMAVWRGKNLGIVFQFFQLLPMLTLVENVMLPMDFCNIYAPASRPERAMELLRRVGLDELAHKLPGAVSGGQQQSAAVARALANDPPILIADEPTGNLDSKTAQQVMEIFTELVAQGKTILLVTHDHALAQCTDRLLLISDGELVDERLVAAFPGAPHEPLLALSKQARPLRLAAGEALFEAATGSMPLFLMAHGELVAAGLGATAALASGVLIDPTSIDCDLRAGAEGAELLALPRDRVLPLLSAARPAPAFPSPDDQAQYGSFHRRSSP